MKAAIIGGGLAGTSCAYVLKQRGIDAVIYEAGDTIAFGASGNELGLYNPRLSANQTPESLFYSSAFALAVKTFPELENIKWSRCGALHLMTDETRQKRYPQTFQNWNWHDDHMQIVNAKQASDIAGVELSYDALYLPDSGTVSPRGLCNAYAKDAKIHLNTKIENLDDIDADIIILACGMAATHFTDLPLQSVRGQITEVKSSTLSKNLKTNLCYGGYFTPQSNGTHWIGSTFQRWLDHTDILPEDDADNIQKLSDIAPDLAKDLQVINHRAALRTTAKDHFPIIGHVKDNIYVSTAHGSHGILSTLAGAHILANMAENCALGQSTETLSALCPSRFFHAKNTA